MRSASTVSKRCATRPSASPSLEHRADRFVGRFLGQPRTPAATRRRRPRPRRRAQRPAGSRGSGSPVAPYARSAGTSICSWSPAGRRSAPSPSRRSRRLADDDRASACRCRRCSRTACRRRRGSPGCTRSRCRTSRPRARRSDPPRSRSARARSAPRRAARGRASTTSTTSITNVRAASGGMPPRAARLRRRPVSRDVELHAVAGPGADEAFVPARDPVAGAER